MVTVGEGGGREGEGEGEGGLAGCILGTAELGARSAVWLGSWTCLRLLAATAGPLCSVGPGRRRSQRPQGASRNGVPAWLALARGQGRDQQERGAYARWAGSRVGASGWSVLRPVSMTHTLTCSGRRQAAWGAALLHGRQGGGEAQAAIGQAA